MRYILMMHAPRSADGYQINKWQPEALKAHMNFMFDLNKDLVAAGEWVDGQGLAAPNEARVVRADAKGQPVVTDGPFPESKEFLAGYWIVEVPNAERAYEIAARASTAPGPDNQPLNMPIEMRQVLSAPLTE
jgi:hypothetical protein